MLAFVGYSTVKTEIWSFEPVYSFNIVSVPEGELDKLLVVP